MSIITPFSSSDPSIKRVGGVTHTAATPKTEDVQQHEPAGESYQGTALVKAEDATPVVSTQQSWASRMASKLGEWALALIPSPVTTAASAIKDVITGETRQSHFEYKKEFPDEAAAQSAFTDAKGRLFDPNNWRQLGPLIPTNFQVYSGTDKKPNEGAPAEGDYLSIKLPDPGPPVWVQIEEIKDGDDHAQVVVRPSENPTKNNPETVIHLFGDDTRNVFQIRREGNALVSSVTGVDETPNRTGNVFQQAFAGARLAGAWMGAKKPQWNAFTRNLVEGPPERKPFSLQGTVTSLATYLGLMQPDKITKD